MKAQFLDMHAAADFLGPGAIEVNVIRPRSSISCGGAAPSDRGSDKCRRPGIRRDSLSRLRSSRPTAAQAFVDPRNIVATVGSPTRVERSVPLKALVSQINYNLFDMEVGAQQSQFAFLQAKDLADAVDGLMRTHDVALWNGNDTSLSAPTTTQYFGAIGQITPAATRRRFARPPASWTGIKSTIARMVSNSSYEVRPTAIYANPVLLDLIDREMKSGIQRRALDHRDGRRTDGEDALDAGRRPAAHSGMVTGVHGNAGQRNGSASRYIVTEDLIEYHWLTDANPRVFPTRAARDRWLPDGSGEIWRGGSERRFLRALRSEGRPIETVASCQWPAASTCAASQLTTGH